MQETFLVADVGGTNTTFAFVGLGQKKYRLLHLLHFPSQEIKDFTSIVAEVLAFGESKNYYVDKACFAGAGVVSEKNDFCRITKLPWVIDATEIQKKTSLRSILVINDFIAVAYGIEKLPRSSVIPLKPGKVMPRKPKAIIGAGTALGKAVLIWDVHAGRYFPLASEGGHGNIPIRTAEEWALAQFIQKKYRKERVSQGDLVSGRGISDIYQFLESSRRHPSTSRTRKIQENNYDPALICSFRQDPNSLAAVDLFLRFYARCAQNLALDTLALGGIYLAGGIVMKNPGLFKRKPFIDEFVFSTSMKRVLEQIPVFALTDYNVSLYGAAQALQLYLQGDFP